MKEKFPIKEIISYIVDGKTFYNKLDAEAYQDLLLKIDDIINGEKTLDDKRLDFMVVLQNIVQMDKSEYEEYVKIIKMHKNCSVYCHLWKVLGDYKFDYPILVKAYNELFVSNDATEYWY